MWRGQTWTPVPLYLRPRVRSQITRDAIGSSALGPPATVHPAKPTDLLSPHGTTWIWQVGRCSMGPAWQWWDGSFSYREGRPTFARPSNDVHPPSCNYSSRGKGLALDAVLFTVLPLARTSCFVCSAIWLLFYLLMRWVFALAPCKLWYSWTPFFKSPADLPTVAVNYFLVDGNERQELALDCLQQGMHMATQTHFASCTVKKCPPIE